MTDNEMRRAIRKAAPGLNVCAVNRMLVDFRCESFGRKAVPMPANEAEVAARVKRIVDEVQEMWDKIDGDLNRRIPSAKIKTDAIEALNENADEVAAEARMS